MSNYINKPLVLEKDGLKLKGIYYLPKDQTNFPLVIISPGFGSQALDNEDLAIFLASNGFGALIYDYIGGTIYGRSDGSVYDSSVLTEADDLQLILKNIDNNNIFLVGFSQGGFVTTVASANTDVEVKGIVLIYPALVIPDDVKKNFPNINEIPDHLKIFNNPVGKKYVIDAYGYDIYKDLRSINVPILILHGDMDGIAPLSYSIKAKEENRRVILKVYKNEGHGFSSHARKEMYIDIARFIDIILYQEQLKTKN